MAHIPKRNPKKSKTENAAAELKAQYDYAVAELTQVWLLIKAS